MINFRLSFVQNIEYIRFLRDTVKYAVLISTLISN